MTIDDGGTTPGPDGAPEPGAQTDPAMFTGLSAFPLTPMSHDEVDERSLIGLIQNLVAHGVDSIAPLGSTGSYAYLGTSEREWVVNLAVEHAQGTPVIAGVGAPRTAQVLTHIARAERAGVDALLLAPVTYQALDEDEVYTLYRAVSDYTALPVVVYDNPTTTGFTFTPQLYARIAALPGVASIKIPGVPADAGRARTHIESIRQVVPEDVTIGVSGDPVAATGLIAGCDAWYSVIGGTLPAPALEITRAALNEQGDRALEGSERLGPLWQLFTETGSLRVVAAIAEHLEWVHADSLPAPLHGLDETQRARLSEILADLNLVPPQAR